MVTLTPQKTYIGIDLGTSNSVACRIFAGEPDIIPTADGQLLTPSWVAFSQEGLLVGQPAVNQASVNPQNTIHSAKRLLGRPFSSVTAAGLSYQVENDGQNQPVIRLRNGKQVRPEQISAEVLRRIKEDAEIYLGRKVDGAVITVPAYFNEKQRAATKAAAEIAGLKCLELRAEPTAAALAYGIDQTARQNVVVFDLGGGTFDVSVLKVGDGIFNPRAVGGDTNLGGNDWTDLIIRWIIEQFENQFPDAELARLADTMEDPETVWRLRQAAERAKIELTAHEKTAIRFVGLLGRNFEATLTREEFEERASNYLEAIEYAFTETMEQANMEIGEIDEVILVGGATRMPMIIEKVRAMTGREPLNSINPDTAVAVGAAWRADKMAGGQREFRLFDVLPIAIGYAKADGTMVEVIPRNTNMPAHRIAVVTTVQNGQQSLRLDIYQGQRALAKENRCLGSLTFRKLPRAAKGAIEIVVRFELDKNGLLHVQANNKSTGNVIEADFETESLDPKRVEALVKEAEEMRQADQQHLRLEGAKKEARRPLAWYKRKGNFTGYTQSSVADCHEAANALTALLEGEDAEAIYAAAQALRHALGALEEAKEEAAVLAAV